MNASERLFWFGAMLFIAGVLCGVFDWAFVLVPGGLVVCLFSATAQGLLDH